MIVSRKLRKFFIALKNSSKTMLKSLAISQIYPEQDHGHIHGAQDVGNQGILQEYPLVPY